MIVRRDWTPREDAILQQGALMEQTVGEIARMVGRTMSAVLTRARNRQIKLKRRSTSESLSAPLGWPDPKPPAWRDGLPDRLNASSRLAPIR